MTDSENPQDENGEYREAQKNFKAAFNRLTEETTTQFDELVDNIEEGVRTTIQTFTHSVAAGVREIKDELNVANAVRRQPLAWVAGAAAAGAALAFAVHQRRRQLVVPRLGIVAGQAMNVAQKVPALAKFNWAVLAVEIGMEVWRAHQHAKAQKINLNTSSHLH